MRATIWIISDVNIKITIIGIVSYVSKMKTLLFFNLTRDETDFVLDIVDHLRNFILTLLHLLTIEISIKSKRTHFDRENSQIFCYSVSVFHMIFSFAREENHRFRTETVDTHGTHYTVHTA